MDRKMCVTTNQTERGGIIQAGLLRKEKNYPVTYQKLFSFPQNLFNISFEFRVCSEKKNRLSKILHFFANIFAFFRIPLLPKTAISIQSFSRKNAKFCISRKKGSQNVRIFSLHSISRKMRNFVRAANPSYDILYYILYYDIHIKFYFFT